MKHWKILCILITWINLSFRSQPVDSWSYQKMSAWSGHWPATPEEIQALQNPKSATTNNNNNNEIDPSNKNNNNNNNEEAQAPTPEEQKQMEQQIQQMEQFQKQQQQQFEQFQKQFFQPFSFPWMFTPSFMNPFPFPFGAPVPVPVPAPQNAQAPETGVKNSQNVNNNLPKQQQQQLQQPHPWMFPFGPIFPSFPVDFPPKNFPTIPKGHESYVEMTSYQPGDSPVKSALSLSSSDSDSAPSGESSGGSSRGHVKKADDLGPKSAEIDSVSHGHIPMFSNQTP